MSMPPSEISYSRVNHPDEFFNIGDKHDKVINVDLDKLQIVVKNKMTDYLNILIIIIKQNYKVKL